MTAQPASSSTAPALSQDALDEILMWQLLVAWAGERAASDAPRLSWWNTDLTDPIGGGDFLERLLPVTHRWAGFRGAREAARRIELGLLRALGGAGRVQSLFWIDRTTDELLEERMDTLSIQLRQDPDRALRWPCATDAWNRAVFERSLQGSLNSPSGSSFQYVSGGREVRGVPAGASTVERVRALVAALVPLADSYPMPFLR